MPDDDSADKAAASREKAKTILAETPAIDSSLTPGQRRYIAIERRKQAAAQTQMDPEIRSLILKMTAEPDGTSTRQIEEALEQQLGQERGLSRNGAWRYLDVLRFEGIVELRGKGRGRRWHLRTTADPEEDLERLAEDAEEQAMDNLIDHADDYEE